MSPADAVLALCWCVIMLTAASGCHDRTVNVSHDDRITMVDVQAGQGLRVIEGATVTVMYNLRLPDGTKPIDFFKDRTTHTFIVGDGTVIPGFDLAVRGMRDGGIREAHIPWGSAYGSIGHGDAIPPRTNIDMRIKVLRVEGGKP